MAEKDEKDGQKDGIAYCLGNHTRGRVGESSPALLCLGVGGVLRLRRAALRPENQTAPGIKSGAVWGAFRRNQPGLNPGCLLFGGMIRANRALSSVGERMTNGLHVVVHEELNGVGGKFLVGKVGLHPHAVHDRVGGMEALMS